MKIGVSIVIMFRLWLHLNKTILINLCGVFNREDASAQGYLKIMIVISLRHIVPLRLRG